MQTQIRPNYVVRLTWAEAEQFKRPLQGHGGFQALLNRLHRQFVGSDLWLTEKDVRQIKNYAQGKGGFQKRLNPILVQLTRLGVM